LAGGGALKVPCLRIEDEQSQVEWLYESAAIIRYLESRFVTTQPVAATVQANAIFHNYKNPTTRTR